MKIRSLIERSALFLFVSACAGTASAQTQSSAPLSGIVAISGGGLVNCALISNGTVECWGDNVDGQLGNGTTAGFSSSPVQISGLTGVKGIHLGEFFACALLAAGSVECWGGAAGYPYGGPGGLQPIPTPVSGISGAIALANGETGFHNCALFADGSVQCWGNEVFGQLGNGTSCIQSGGCSSLIAVQVTGLPKATAVTAGYSHSCALLSDSTVQCWGSDVNGQLGDGGSETLSSSPVPVTGLSSVIAVVAGANHTCALLAGGTVDCWGANSQGQLGNGTSVGSNTPQPVTGLSGAVAITAGDIHTCALLGDGTVRCWGNNSVGQLGDNTTTNSSLPVAVTGLTGAVALGASAESTCALLGNQTEQCWGDDSAGELGNGISIPGFPASSIAYTGPVNVTGGQTSIPTCNCTLTGNYVDPVAAADPTNDALTSPHNKYIVSATQDNADQLTSLTVKNSSGGVVFNQTLPISTNWGFSPDDDRFVINFVDTGGLNEVQVWDLSASPATRLVQTSILTSASRLQFSPSGRYFLNTTLLNSSTTQMQIYRVQGVTTQALVFQTQFAFAVGSGDQFGAVNWGFSPDNPETSFVFAFLTGQGSFQWNLVNLAAGRQVQSQSITTVAAFWQFDPCGDVAALVTQPSGSADQIALYDTTTGDALAGSGATIPSLSITLETTATGQEVQYSGQTVPLSPSTCGQPNTPTGANVSVTPKDGGNSTSPVNITFANVTQAGETTVSIGATGPNPAAPTDFQLGNPPVYYDLSSTATFSGTTTVCINYGGSTFLNGSAIRLYHFTNGSWVDITTSVNPATTTVCGNTSSFSPYALFEPSSPLPATLTPSLGTPQQTTINTSFTAALQATVTGTDGNPLPGIVVTFTAPTAGATGIFASVGSLATATTGTNGVAIAPPFVADGTAGSYTVTASANGVATPAAFSLTNSPATPVIVWTPATPIVYGTPLGASQLDATASLAGSFTYNPPAGTFLAAGSRTLSVTFVPSDSVDYTSAAASVSLSVTPATLVITAANNSRSYGQANPSLTAAYSGFVNGDTPAALAGTLSCTTTATPASPVGTYPIVCSGLTSTNYAISFVPGTLAVTQAAATITANNLTKSLDSPNPALTFTASGFVNGDTATVLTMLPTCVTTATTTSPVGSYAITCSGASALNYTFTYVSGTLTVLASTCHYVSLALSPSTVPLGGVITVKAELMSCASTLQVIAEEFSLSGPLDPDTCGQGETVMFETPPFPLPPKTAQSVTFPVHLPEHSCPGNYTITVKTLLKGKIIDTSSASLTVSGN